MSLIDEHRELLQTEAGAEVALTDGPYRRFGKRALDLVIAIIALALAIPVLLLVLAGLRWQLGPGLLLRQRRIGRHGRPFEMFKLRTMEASRRTVDPVAVGYSGPDRRQFHKSELDPRHTAFGRLARKFSLDELPQLWNVIRGDMALVGPRPQLEARASEEFRAHCRHLVRPGLTGPFQVSEMRTRGNLDEGLGLDATYAATVSLRNDLRFLFQTIGALVRGTGS